MSDFPFARGGSLESCPRGNRILRNFWITLLNLLCSMANIIGPPLLDRANNRVEGLAYIGLCLTRHYTSTEEIRSHPASVTRQAQFDFNEIQDRDYKYFVATNDDGWLVGGGESEDSYKLPSADSAHCEIIRIGTFDERLGGVSVERIDELMRSGKILIPHIAITPSFVLRNKDSPPEIELKFECEPDESTSCDQWPNWQLHFLHNQLFEHLKFPGRFCPGPFHMTFVRKAAFRSPEHMREYFSNCNEAVARWRERGPTLLEPERDPSAPGYPSPILGDELVHPHGVYLFRHRKLPIRYYAPNFHPPYDTPENKAIIREILGRKWNEHSLQWD